MSGQTSRDSHQSRGSTDRELWSEELAWGLTQAESDLGIRSTTGAVISAIERGGAQAAAADSNAFHEAMVTRIANGEPVERYRRFHKRWWQLPHSSQRTHMAHYVGAEMGRRFEFRFGEVAGVVAQLWLDQCRERRALTAGRISWAAGDALAVVLEELSAAETLAPAGSLAEWEERQEQLRALVDAIDEAVSSGLTGFVARSALGIASRAVTTLRAIRTLRSQQGVLLSAYSTQAAPVDLEQDLDALHNVCTKQEPPGLRQRATEAIRAAHREWNATAPTDRPEPRTKVERRKERADSYFRREGL